MKPALALCALLIVPFLLPAPAAADQAVAYRINALPVAFRVVAPRYLVESHAEFTVEVPPDRQGLYLLRIVPEVPAADGAGVPVVLRVQAGDLTGTCARQGGNVRFARIEHDTADWPDGAYVAELLAAGEGGEGVGEPLAAAHFRVVRGWAQERFADPRQQGEMGVWLEHVNRPRDIWKKVPTWTNMDRLFEDASAAVGDLRGMVLRSYWNEQLGRLQPYGVYVPGAYDPDEPMPLLVLLHGSGGNYLNIVSDLHEGQELESHPMLIANAGAFSRQEYRHMAVNDVLWVIEDMRRKYNVDPSRIYLQGISLGGRGSLEIPALVPGVFAAASPQGVYGAFREPSDPAAFSNLPEFHRWQIARWDLRSYLANLRGVPMQIIFGHHDTTTPSLHALTFRHMLNGVHGGRAEAIGFDRGHDISWPHYKWSDTREWMLRHSLDPSPARVTFRTPGLRYDTMHWVRVVSLVRHWRMGEVDAQWNAQAGVARVELRNVDALVISPGGACRQVIVRDLDAGDEAIELAVEGHQPGEPIALVREGSVTWRLGEPVASGVGVVRKRHGVSGPIWDVASGRCLAVYGTAGSEEETRALRATAERLTRMDTTWGGGWQLVADVDVTDEQKQTSNLLLVGDARTNGLLMGHDWPFDLAAVGRGEGFTVLGRTYDAPGTVLCFVAPSPYAADRYAYVVSPQGSGAPARIVNPTDTWTIATWADWVVLTPRGGRSYMMAGVFDAQWRPCEEGSSPLAEPRYMNWER